MTRVGTARTTWNQDVWWTDVEGITRLIDDLTDGHRRNIAALMVRNAASHYTLKRTFELWYAWATLGGPYGNDLDDPDLDPPDEDEEKAQIAAEIADGKHLKWVAGTKLFRRMVRDIDRAWLPRPVAALIPEPDPEPEPVDF